MTLRDTSDLVTRLKFGLPSHHLVHLEESVSHLLPIPVLTHRIMAPLCSTPSRGFSRELSHVFVPEVIVLDECIFYYDYKAEFSQRGMKTSDVVDSETDSDSEDSGLESLDDTDGGELLQLSDVWSSDNPLQDLTIGEDPHSADDAEQTDSSLDSSRQSSSSRPSNFTSSGYRRVLQQPLLHRSTNSKSGARRRLFVHTAQHAAEEREE